MNRNRNIIIAVVASMVAVCLCLCIAVAVAPPPQTPVAAATSAATQAALPITGGTVSPTDTPVPTSPPAATATPQASGQSRSSPIPAGAEVKLDDYLFKITRVTRPADQIVAQANMFNKTPEVGQEYIIVDLQMQCTLSADQKCSVNPFSFKLVGSVGNVYDVEFVTGVEGKLESGEFFGGSSKSGKIVYLVGKGESDLILIYSALFSETYFRLPDPS